VLYEFQLLSKALNITLHCVKLAGRLGDDSDVNFLASVAGTLRRSLCGVDWNVRDTAVECIDKAFLSGWFDRIVIYSLL